jgi:predicted nucleotidyltransferase
MSILYCHDGLSLALFGRARAELLTLFYTHSTEAYYVREIVRMLGVGNGAVQRELSHLVNAGLVSRKVIGRHVFYQAETRCPIFKELQSLVAKTAGIADILKEALSPLGDRLWLAFIYGSFARGDAKATSDLDLMLVGDVEFGEVVRVLGMAQDQIGREINPAVYRRQEIRQKVEKREHFVTSVLRSPIIPILGDVDELRTMAQL